MKIALIIVSVLLAGCATNPEVQKSISKDKKKNTGGKATSSRKLSY